MASLKELRLPHENWELTGWIIRIFEKKNIKNITNLNQILEAHASIFQLINMTCIAKLKFESAYVHIIHPDVWRNLTAPFVFTTAEVEQITNFAHHSSTHHRPYKLKQPTNQPLTKCLFLCSTLCVQFGQLLVCLCETTPDLPKWKYTQPRIATNSWRTFQTFPNHLGSKSSNGKNWQIEKTFKQQETSNFIKLL